MNVIPLLEGVYHVDENKDFHFISEELIDGKPEKGYYLIVRPFLIQTESDNILIDCGYGGEIDCEPIILRRLREHNITPNQITKVLISHLHKDHINGVGSWTGEQFVCNFPNAEIFIQQREYDYAVAQTNNSYNYERLAKMKSFKNIVWMNDDKGSFSDEITFELTGGHVPFQQVFWIKENQETVFYGADNLPQLNYLKYHAAFKNDVDGVKAMEDRLRWEVDAEKEHWKILFYHGKRTDVKQF
jgi:glyoxylase-like metal-dependent hydrolase (beta-lactamase superfamily II)